MAIVPWQWAARYAHYSHPIESGGWTYEFEFSKIRGDGLVEFYSVPEAEDGLRVGLTLSAQEACDALNATEMAQDARKTMRTWELLDGAMRWMNT